MYVDVFPTLPVNHIPLCPSITIFRLNHKWMGMQAASRNVNKCLRRASPAGFGGGTSGTAPLR